jgi:hypothetical protein
MGTIAWQYGQVGDWNFTRLGLGKASTSASKLLESRTTTFDEPAPAGGVAVVVGEDAPWLHPVASRPATSAAAAPRLTADPPPSRERRA